MSQLMKANQISNATGDKVDRPAGNCNSETRSKSQVAEQTQQHIELATADIGVDATVNVRHDDISLDTVDLYSENPNLPAVHVMLIGGKYYLVDGQHRLLAAGKRGDKFIKCIVVGTGTLTHAQDYADMANLAHGLPLTRAQKQAVAVRIHQRHPDWSNREIAKRMGVSHPTIAAWLPEAPKRSSPGKIYHAGDDNDANSQTAGLNKQPAAVVSPPGAIDDTKPTTPHEESAADGEVLAVKAPAANTVSCPKCHYEFVP
jgi:hypothetical protein